MRSHIQRRAEYYFPAVATTNCTKFSGLKQPSSGIGRLESKCEQSRALLKTMGPDPSLPPLLSCLSVLAAVWLVLVRPPLPSKQGSLPRAVARTAIFVRPLITAFRAYLNPV